jgi:hypothetical protein
MEQSGLSCKIKTVARFTRKTGARKAKLLQTPPFGRQTGSIFTLLATLTVGSHLFFGSPDKVGRPRGLQNLKGRFADNHIKFLVFYFSEVELIEMNFI